MYRISLLGRFRLQLPDKTDVTSFESAKVQELFCYLLCHRERPHNRELLASMLWQDSTDRTRRYLRKALWQLGHALHPAGLESETPLLIVEAEWVQINPAADYWLDIAVLEDGYDRVRDVAGEELAAGQVSAIKAALAAYHGELLEGCFHDWCLLERERMQYRYLGLLDKMMRYCEARGAYEEGIGYGELVLRQDIARENTHRSLIRLYCLSHRRMEAIRQYKKCVAALRDELDVEPSRRTRLLYRQILGERWPAESQAHSTQLLSGQLGQLRTSLATLKGQLAQTIDDIDHTFD